VCVLARGQAEVPTCSKAAVGIPVAQDFIQHPINEPLLPRIAPEALPKDSPTTISLRLFVDTDGSVARVCYVRSRGKAPRAVELLAKAAEESVKSWKYPKDFGLSGNLRIMHRQVQGVVVFRFGADGITTKVDPAERPD
jgi:hypothetical protein